MNKFSPFLISMLLFPFANAGTENEMRVRFVPAAATATEHDARLRVTPVVEKAETTLLDKADKLHEDLKEGVQDVKEEAEKFAHRYGREITKGFFSGAVSSALVDLVTPRFSKRPSVVSLNERLTNHGLVAQQQVGKIKLVAGLATAAAHDKYANETWVRSFKANAARVAGVLMGSITTDFVIHAIQNRATPSAQG